MELKLKHNLLDEMAQVGKFDNIEIIVYGTEGPIPHFHFKDTASKYEREGCVRIDKPEYFKHGNYNATFTKAERDELHKFLNSRCREAIIKKYRLSEDMTNYEMVKFLWDMSNPKYETEDDLQMPDYLHNLPTYG